MRAMRNDLPRRMSHRSSYVARRSHGNTHPCAIVSLHPCACASSQALSNASVVKHGLTYATSSASGLGIFGLEGQRRHPAQQHNSLTHPHIHTVISVECIRRSRACVDGRERFRLPCCQRRLTDDCQSWMSKLTSCQARRTEMSVIGFRLAGARGMAAAGLCIVGALCTGTFPEDAVTHVWWRRAERPGKPRPLVVRIVDHPEQHAVCVSMRNGDEAGGGGEGASGRPATVALVSTVRERVVIGCPVVESMLTGSTAASPSSKLSAVQSVASRTARSAAGGGSGGGATRTYVLRGWEVQLSAGVLVRIGRVGDELYGASSAASGVLEEMEMSISSGGAVRSASLFVVEMSVEVGASGEAAAQKVFEEVAAANGWTVSGKIRSQIAVDEVESAAARARVWAKAAQMKAVG
jgi:hypothetical protein